jgi:hypothetical protein
MMAIVIHDHDAVLLSAHLKPALHSRKHRQSPANKIDGHVQLQADRDRGQRVRHVVPTRYGQSEWSEVPFVVECTEVRFPLFQGDVGSPEIRQWAVGTLFEPVGLIPLEHARKHGSDPRVVCA